MNKPLTAEHFYKFFQCPHWIWYDIYGDQSRKGAVPALLELINRGKTSAASSALKTHKKFEELKPEAYKDLEEAHRATLELMKQGKNIYHGVLMHNEWVGMPDLLEARPGSSRFGPWQYVVYDAQRSLELRDEHKFPLVFYSLILETIQGVRPTEAYMIDPAGNERSFAIADFIDQFHLTREEIERVLDGEKPAPFLKSTCKRTPWYSLCLEETEGCNDVSLVYRLSQSDQRRLYDIGIHTVRDLAEANPEMLRTQLEDWPYDKIIRFSNQARALHSGQPLVLRTTSFPEVATELYFDIESDPIRDVDYLLGVLQVESATGKDTYHSFVAKDASGEEAMWRSFLDFLAPLENYAVYHYAGYERQVFDRLALKYSAPSVIVDAFRERSIDVHQRVLDAVVLPLYFYTLKDVAKFLGFTWRDPRAGGAESVLWFDQYISTGDAAILEQLLAYNEDDVRATRLVKEWLAAQKPQKGEHEMLDAS